MNIANPQLWYRNDLKNHPELIALDGQTINIHKAHTLAEVYPGTALLNEKVTKLTSKGFINANITLSVDFFQGLYLPAALCGDELSIDNIMKVSDQWLTGSSKLDKEHHVTISFNHTPHLVTEYWVIPAFGTVDQIDAKRPTPKTWTLEGSNDGVNWDIIDQHNEKKNHWQPFKGRSFKVKTNTEYAKIKLSISAWHPGTDDELFYTGLRRFWLFGRPKDSFILPKLDTPSDDFVWVVPYK